MIHMIHKMHFSQSQFVLEGYTCAREIYSAVKCQALIDHLSLHIENKAGERDLLRFAQIKDLANADEVRAFIDELLSPAARPVRAILFNKSPGHNWFVGWHQDLTIAVKEKIATNATRAYGPWSMKEGITHVQPPIHVLRHMATMRLHLDDADETNGALRVLPSSHRQIAAVKPDLPEVICPMKQGDALFMSPLIWHASSKAISPSHRRVIHIEYADCKLEEPLDWYERGEI